MPYNPPIPQLYNSYASWTSKKIKSYKILNVKLEEKIYILETKNYSGSELMVDKLKRRIESNNKRIEALYLTGKKIRKEGKKQRM